MKRILVVLVMLSILTVLVSIAVPVGASENVTTTDNSLERRIVDLEKRVRELEAISNGTPAKASRIPTSGNWKDLQNWRKLRTGMSYDEVRALLGEPENINGGIMATWYYGSRESTAQFFRDKLQSWSEPR